MMNFMIIDDSSTMRKIITIAIKSVGYNFIEAENGKDALDKLQNNKIDFFIVDINMPEMNGFELIRQLRTKIEHKDTPVIVITTETGLDKKKEGEALGVESWLIKPFQKDQLLQVIKSVIK
ncbi:MAG: hypothetical protein A2Y34_09750 [Spirochaetes bacterium GWC1_27_15]|nr:MAG: hypothetical protein A2Y34_09750 [Spirochaetes bacterium GWC1_27_15]